jgi:hypothetical protein
VQSQVETPPPLPRKGLAIASLILGIIGIPTLGMCFVGGIAGVVLGAVALNKTKVDPTHYTGKGLALAGIITNLYLERERPFYEPERKRSYD